MLQNLARYFLLCHQRSSQRNAFHSIVFFRQISKFGIPAEKRQSLVQQQEAETRREDFLFCKPMRKTLQRVQGIRNLRSHVMEKDGGLQQWVLQSVQFVPVFLC